MGGRSLSNSFAVERESRENMQLIFRRQNDNALSTPNRIQPAGTKDHRQNFLIKDNRLPFFCNLNLFDLIFGPIFLRKDADNVGLRRKKQGMDKTCVPMVYILRWTIVTLAFLLILSSPRYQKGIFVLLQHGIDPSKNW